MTDGCREGVIVVGYVGLLLGERVGLLDGARVVGGVGLLLGWLVDGARDG